MVVSLGLECWAVTHDLPYPGVDEPVFVRPAVHIRVDRRPSTSLVRASRVRPRSTRWRACTACGTRSRTAAPSSRRTPAWRTGPRKSPGDFYLIGRLWSITFTIAAIPAASSSSDGVVSRPPSVWPARRCGRLIPLAVSYGREVRTDSAGVFFALLGAVPDRAALRARASLRDQFVAGARRRPRDVRALLPGDTRRRARRRRRDRPARPRARRIDPGIAASTGATMITFVLTTPYFCSTGRQPGPAWRTRAVRASATTDFPHRRSPVVPRRTRSPMRSRSPSRCSP